MKKEKSRRSTKEKIGSKNKDEAKGIVEACKAFGASKDETARMLASLLSVSRSEAQQMLGKNKSAKRKNGAPPPDTHSQHEEIQWDIDPEAEPYGAVMIKMAMDMSQIVGPLIEQIFETSIPGDAKTIWEVAEPKNLGVDGSVESSQSFPSLTVERPPDEPRFFDIQFNSSKNGDMYFLLTQSYPSSMTDIANGRPIRAPRFAAVYLWSPVGAPETFEAVIPARPDDEKDIIVDSPVLALERMTPRQLFRDHMFVLVPYYLFTHGSRLEHLENSEDGRRELLAEAAGVAARLANESALSVEERVGLLLLTAAVAQNLLTDESARKGVVQIMHISAEACRQQEQENRQAPQN